MSQVIGVPRETAAGEKRVATVPEVVERLVKLGFKVAVQSGAGEAANFGDDAYRASGAEVVADAAGLWRAATRYEPALAEDLVLGACPPNEEARALDARYECRSFDGRAYWRRAGADPSALVEASP